MRNVVDALPCCKCLWKFRCRAESSSMLAPKFPDLFHESARVAELLGIRAEGIRILDPECTGKTYPNYFEDLESLCKSQVS